MIFRLSRIFFALGGRIGRGAMKNLILFPFLILNSVGSFATENTSKCIVTSDTLTDNTAAADGERYLLAKYRTGGSQGYFDSLQFVIRDFETGVEKVEDLFLQTKRGGYEIRYCAPDDREYLEPIEKFNWYSTCTGVSPFRQIRGRVSLSKRKVGTVKINAVREDFTSEKREITTDTCN